MTILVTGASGFIGKHVLSQLLGRPLRLLVLPHDPALSELERWVDVVVGDVTQLHSLPPALQGIRQVIHLAGHVNGGRGTAETYMNVNTKGTANLARVAREAGVEHFIFTSSVTVYGHVREADESAPLLPPSGYPTSKLGAEALLRQLLPEQTTVLRLPLVIGSGDAGFMCPFWEGIRQLGRTVLIGSGREPWSVLAASDAARAIAFCLERPQTRSHTYNVSGQTVANGDLLRAIGAGAGATKELHLPYPIAWLMGAFNELRGSEGLTRAQARALGQPLSVKGDRFAQLGFEPEVDWRQALEWGMTWCEEKKRNPWREKDGRTLRQRAC